MFCGAMGAGWGYMLAGHDVTGWDLKRRRHLPPGANVQVGDAMEVLADHAFMRSRFDLIHASPPCQRFTRAKHLAASQGHSSSKADLVDPVRRHLDAIGLPYIIENVPDSPLRPDVVLCGSMFGLHVTLDGQRRWLQRHRVFELGGWWTLAPACDHTGAGTRPLGVYHSKGDRVPDGGQTAPTLDAGRALMGMPWASWSGLVEAIPPAYTRWLVEAYTAQQGGDARTA